MQEKEPPLIHLGPDTKSVERLWCDLRDGSFKETTEALILDEEKTHAAEILALISKRGAIPREYILSNDDLIDIHGLSLRSVLGGGIIHAEKMLEDGKPGSDWELARRQIEKETLEQVLTMLPGEACVEWSPTDMSKPEDERREQGYNGDTLVRLTHRVNEKRFLQFNIVIPCSDLNMLSSVRRKISGERRTFDSAEQMLAEPQFVLLGGMDTGVFARKLEGYIDTALLGSKPGLSVLRMIRRFRERKHDAWKFVSDPKQADIFNALLESFQDAAQLPAHEWQRASGVARGGAWQLIIERYNGQKLEQPKEKTDIKAGAKRAAAAGAVFTACGSSVDMRAVVPDGSASPAERLQVVNSLLHQECGVGSCIACQSFGALYGCGVFCRGCNETWCEEYARTGTQLDETEVLRAKYLHYGRGLRLV